MKFTDSRITQQLVNTVQAIIDGPGGSLTKWKRVMAELHKVNIPYTQHLSISEVMVHPENRGGLGLNTFNVHENLRAIKEIGADREAVHRATCFEMAPVGPDREAQIAFNNQLIERSSGQLAPLSGKERVCSVACSHFTAGCRAAEGASLTPERSLADSDGRLNKISLCCEDQEFKDLIEQGWDWTTLPHTCQKIWPKLPDLAQDALNAEHATFAMASELQVMLSMANRAAASASKGDRPDRQKIKSDITASQPPCVDYLAILCSFVQQYAGGANAPVIRLFEGFAK